MTRHVSLAETLDRAAGPLRGMSGLARLIAGAATAVLILGIASWSLRLGWSGAPIGTLAAWFGSLAAIVAGAVLARRIMVRLDAQRVGATLEDTGEWRNGAVTALLDPPAEGTSEALHRAAADGCAVDVASRAPAALAPAVRRERTLTRRAGAALIGAVICLGASDPVTGAAAGLWHPVVAWEALTAPVRLTTRDSLVASGTAAMLDVTAIGRRHATLFTRAPGETWRAVAIALDANGRATIRTAPLTSDLAARIEAGGHRSAEVRVHVRLAAFLGSLTATAHYPRYLGLDDEVLPATGDTLVVPEGTQLKLAGQATAPLAHVVLGGSIGIDTLTVTGTAFHGLLTPRESGTWQLRIVRADGGALSGDVPSLPIRVVADSAPVVEIPVPGADTIATSAMSLSLVVAIRDDHGITSAAIETRRGNAPPLRTRLTLPGSGGDRALVATALDLAALGLNPGDTLRYLAVAQDNAPVPHVGRSREFVVRVPSLAEQRAARDRQTAATATAFDSVSRRAGQLQQAEEDLARDRPRAGAQPAARSGDDAGKAPLANDAARKAEVAAQEQQAMIDAASKLQQAVQQLRDAAARNGAADSSLTRELGEINQLLDKALSPELRAKLAALQQAVKALDADQTQQSMQDLAAQQAQLKQAMDQARDLFKRAALETELTDMGQQAKQLAADQQDLTHRMASQDSAHTSSAEQDLARRTDSLASGLDRAAQQSPAAKPRAGLQQVAEQARQAAGEMRQAAQSSQQGQAAAAQQQAKQAEDQLDPLSKKIDDNRQGMQAEMRAEVKLALERALEETSRLAQYQLDVVNAFQQGALLTQARTDQGLVEEGAAKLAQQVTAVSAMNALVSPQAGVALAEARRLMRETVDAVSAANPDARTALDKSTHAVDALAVVAFSLMQSKDRVSGSQSGSGVQEAMEQLAKMAGQQGQLADQGGALMQQGSPSAQQLMMLAMRQRAVQQQLERMRAGGELPGAGEMAQDAKDLSQDMQAGRLDQDVVARQRKLFQHMLDAGRTLQGQEDDDSHQRHATTAKDAPPSIPPALDPRIRSGAGEIRLPGWEALQRLPADERRRVVEYFQRLTQTDSAGGSGP